MRVLICGSRDFDDVLLMHQVMQSLQVDDTVITGGARGADNMAWIIATIMRIKDRPVYRAIWRDSHGVYNPQAGFERNTEMLVEGKPDEVWAFFHKGRTGGTMDTVMKAQGMGIKVVEFGL